MPWAFPRNFRAPPTKSSRRQRLLSFLRGAAPDRSLVAAGSRGSTPAPLGGPAAPVFGTSAAGSAAAGATGGVVFSELLAPALPRKGPRGSPFDGEGLRAEFGAMPQQAPAASAAMAAAVAGSNAPAVPPRQLGTPTWAGQSEEAVPLAAGSSNSNPLPDPAVQQCCGIVGGGGSSIRGGSSAAGDQYASSEPATNASTSQAQPHLTPAEAGSASVAAVATKPVLPPWPSRGILGSPQAGSVGGGSTSGGGGGAGVIGSHSYKRPQQGGSSAGDGSTGGSGFKPVSTLPAAQGSLPSDAPGEP